MYLSTYASLFTGGHHRRHHRRHRSLSILFELQLIGMNMRKCYLEIMAQQRLHLDRHESHSFELTNKREREKTTLPMSAFKQRNMLFTVSDRVFAHIPFFSAVEFGSVLFASLSRARLTSLRPYSTQDMYFNTTCFDFPIAYSTSTAGSICPDFYSFLSRILAT